MNKIKLFNRDGADLWLENTGEQVVENIVIWKLNVDNEHKYVLEFCRYIGEYGKAEDGAIEFSDIQSIDPSGGPMISLGDEFEGKYKIVKINSVNNIWISERNNN